ncbi:thiolase family protein [Evansella halocellulosilytica]|uniref:thiolase family protein n=1 Tax=Evansella halocellulosilytica TaxID=2011013 RepID=UPI000BB84A88|nr:thiolase family protein [Evansella halocellulosilytica]
MDNEVVVVSTGRTAVGRYGGTLRSLNSGQLAATVIINVLRKGGISPHFVDEVILGEVRQTTESSNVARVAALRAGIPETATAYTVNRLCASGMQAITSGVQQIWANQADIVLAGGTESMSQAPIYLRQSRFGEGNSTLVDSNLENGQQPQEIYSSQLSMGITAENVAERYDISRSAQDKFAFQSQKKAAEAIQSGKFKDEIVPVQVMEKKGTVSFDVDEFPRPDTTIDKLNQLKPVFKQHGTVTPGNSCGRNDGAAAIVLMKHEKARALQLKPLAKIADWTTAGVSPDIMGIGPVPAINKLLKKTGISLSEVGLIELNEAFAAQALAVIRNLQLNEQIVNVNGGAIALGHPLGATGCKIVTSLIYEMNRRKERYGLAALCVGGGQGMALLLEQV